MDHFSEDEARRIFAEAARSRPAAHAEGLSLAELQEIGRAAGLDPDAVAAAAATLREAPLGIPTWGRTPLATRCTRVVPGALGDDAWAEAVAGFRREFKAQGTVEHLGRQRTWTHVVGDGSQVALVRVTAEEAGAGTRVTVESAEGSERTAAVVLGAVLGGLAMLFALIGLAKGNPAAAAAVAAGGLVIIAALVAVLRQSAVVRSRRDPVRFDAVLDRVASLAARPPATTAGADAEATAKAPAADDAALGRIDLGDAPDPSSSAAPRRTRA